MSRSEEARLDLFHRRRLVDRLNEDLHAFRAAGSDEAARYCELLLTLIRDGAFDYVAPGTDRRKAMPRSPGTETDGRYRAGRRWFEKKLRRSVARGPVDRERSGPSAMLSAKDPLGRNGRR
jgi:hypothetical protein